MKGTVYNWLYECCAEISVIGSSSEQNGGGQK
jgi:hypothetical protein